MKACEEKHDVKFCHSLEYEQAQFLGYFRILKLRKTVFNSRFLKDEDDDYDIYSWIGSFEHIKWWL